jgi:hypothetical protein
MTLIKKRCFVIDQYDYKSEWPTNICMYLSCIIVSKSGEWFTTNMKINMCLYVMHVGFEALALTEMVMTSPIFWDITLCIPLKVKQCFGGTHHLQNIHWLLIDYWVLYLRKQNSSCVKQISVRINMSEDQQNSPMTNLKKKKVFSSFSIDTRSQTAVSSTLETFFFTL